MRKWINSMLIKFGASACALALLMASQNVQNTCCFASYQPDVPDFDI